MKIIPYSRWKYAGGTIYTTGVNHLRIRFTQKPPPDWMSSNNNQSWEPIVTNIVHNLNEYDNCQWYQSERRFTVPIGKDKLKNLILYVERGAFGIDDVEIFEECPEEMYIENKIFESGSPAFYPYLDGFPYISQSTSKIIATNTEIKSGANTIFTAGEEIALTNGFSVTQEGEASFEIVPCFTYAALQINPEVEIISATLIETTSFEKNNLTKVIGEEKNNGFKYSIYPNPNTGSFIITLPQSKEVVITVFDPMGKAIQEVNSNGLNNITIDLMEYSQGLYFVKITDGETVKIEKVVYKR